jgi:thymidine kinase
MSNIELVKQSNVIGIDKGQFYPDMIEFSPCLEKLGKTMIISGLDGDFMKRPFGKILDLIGHAKRVNKLLAICKTSGKEVPFTMRTIK